MKSIISQTTKKKKLPYIKNYSDIDIVKTKVFSISQTDYYIIKSEVFDYPGTGELITSMKQGYVALQEVSVCDDFEKAQYVYCALIYEDKIFEDVNGWFSGLLNSYNTDKVYMWIAGFLEGINAP